MALNPGTSKAWRGPFACALAFVLLLSAACSPETTTAPAPQPSPPAPEAPASPIAPQLDDVVIGDDFYNIPPDLPTAEPGRLVRVVPILVPPGTKAWRVLYHSTAVDGRDIVVSGLVFAPDVPAEPGSRPVISWGHGSVGLGDKCAPSRLDAFLTEQPFFSELLARGFVIAATDYEGLGTAGPHPWLVGQSEGRGMLDIVRAAAEIPDTAAGDRFLAVGASQGGGAALFAGELAPAYAEDLDLLGVVAAAPAAELNLIASLPSGNFTGVSGFVVMGALGFYAAYPDLALDSILRPEIVAQADAINGLCQEEIEPRFRGLPLSRILSAPPLSVPSWAEALTKNTAGAVKTDAPVLVVHGARDLVIPAPLSELLFQRLCGLGVKAERRLYPGVGHIEVLGASAGEVLEWLTDRATGRTPSAEKVQQSCN